GRGSKGSMADIQKHVINPCMNGGSVPGSLMEDVIDRLRTGQSSIRKGRHDQKQTWPGLSRVSRSRGATIPDWIRVRVPIAHEKVEIGERGGLSGKEIKETNPS